MEQSVKQTEGRERSRFGAIGDLQMPKAQWCMENYTGPSRDVRRSKFKNKCREYLLAAVLLYSSSRSVMPQVVCRA